MIYKYTSLNGAIKILKSGAVLLNTPDNFNDPFDSKIDIDQNNLDKSLKLAKNYALFKGLCNFVTQKNLKLTKSQKAIFAALQKEIDICKEMINKTKEYKSVPFFNCALNTFSHSNKKLNESLKVTESKFIEKLNSSIQEMRNKIRISCFSKRCDSILMWSHYASSHTGACIEFEEDRKFFKDVIYSKKKPYLNLELMVSRALAFDFLDEKIDFNDEEFASNVLKPLHTKSSDWSYEHEIRCILSDSDLNMKGYKIEEGLFLLEMKIRRILIGSKADDESISELIELANNRMIPIVFMKEDEKSYAIVPDNHRIVPTINNKIISKNRVEKIIDEINSCLETNNYLGAFSLCLIIPGIMGRINYPDLSYKEAYIKWFQENIGQYEKCSDDDEMPYLNGELCYAIKESFHNEGFTNVEFESSEFKITKVKLKIEGKKYFDIYCDGSTFGKDFNGNLKAELEINIRRLWVQLSAVLDREIRDKKSQLDLLPDNIIEDFDKQIDEIRECNVLTEKYNQILNKSRK